MLYACFKPATNLLSIYIYVNGRADVCLSVGMWCAYGNPKPSTDLDEILHTHPYKSEEDFGVGLNPARPLPP